jgi:hypothetical protein
LRLDDIVGRDLMAARYARGSDEYKYNFNMQVSARDMTHQNHLAPQEDVVF